MRVDKLCQMAYKGEPLPDGLSELEAAKYIMLTRLYQLHRQGKLPKEDGRFLKARVLQYEELNRPDRLELLDSFIGSFANENPRAYKTEIKLLSKIYVKEI